jgi:hypothetical protein
MFGKEHNQMKAVKSSGLVLVLTMLVNSCGVIVGFCRATVTQYASGTGRPILPQTISNTATIAALGHQPITRTVTVQTSWYGLVVANDS